ncbi:MAG: hypothetical protein IT276_14715 [Ignavibacteriaceae bacterium]|nr:hypothetical protein [Ignavibacteriaceae bacterium]HRN27152.1 hypothetical protein [Ignavibacteriaceae bacterium]HRQ53695.1 hypothetical protein [Ignavibacteriaceae bacterium]
MNRFKFKIIIWLIFAFHFNANIIAQWDSPDQPPDGINDSTFQQSIIDDSPASAPLNLKPNINNIRYDSSEINIRSVDSAKILIHLKDKDFKYFEDPEYSRTLWERLMDWLNRQFAKLTQFDAYGTVWDIIIYILITLAVAAIIFGFYRSEIKGLFFTNKNKNRLNVSESLEDIHSLDYDTLIEDAIANKNYRYAIRLNYLRTLKILSDKQLIDWKIDKTNSEFIKEIKQSSIKEKFKNITLDFEYIWYGEYEIDSESFKQLQFDYSELNSSLELV